MKRHLPVVPKMQCDDGCGECCGPVACTEGEFKRIEQHAKENDIQPLDQGLTCPWYQKGRCAIYPVRPIVCIMFGYSEELECARGYNVNTFDAEELKRMILSRGEPRRMVHEILGVDLLEYFAKGRSALR